jgi:hypothetical protein
MTEKNDYKKPRVLAELRSIFSRVVLPEKTDVLLTIPESAMRRDREEFFAVLHAAWCEAAGKKQMTEFTINHDYPSEGLTIMASHRAWRAVGETLLKMMEPAKPLRSQAPLPDAVHAVQPFFIPNSMSSVPPALHG